MIELLTSDAVLAVLAVATVIGGGGIAAVWVLSYLDRDPDPLIWPVDEEQPEDEERAA